MQRWAREGRRGCRRLGPGAEAGEAGWTMQPHVIQGEESCRRWAPPSPWGPGGTASMRFLPLTLQSVTTGRLLKNKKNVFFHSSGDQKSEIEVSAGPGSLRRLSGKNLSRFLGFAGTPWLVDASLQSLLLPSRDLLPCALSQHLHMALSLCACSFPLVRTLVTD